ncbi:unnamed protein product [Hyaloperonospora brassicae]|uniref:RxLR effector candidate protein n=1 Tax=Hyaloperonospora brassicae TaxID=162125 RepID=A0AAV0TIT0_HYABA|nr:unnamed protein product [Hyaloperonospora brassicae]
MKNVVLFFALLAGGALLTKPTLASAFGTLTALAPGLSMDEDSTVVRQLRDDVPKSEDMEEQRGLFGKMWGRPSSSSQLVEKFDDLAQHSSLYDAFEALHLNGMTLVDQHDRNIAQIEAYLLSNEFSRFVRYIASGGHFHDRVYEMLYHYFHTKYAALIIEYATMSENLEVRLIGKDLESIQYANWYMGSYEPNDVRTMMTRNLAGHSPPYVLGDNERTEAMLVHVIEKYRIFCDELSGKGATLESTLAKKMSALPKYKSALFKNAKEKI